MSPDLGWEEMNERYLTLALGWVRARLGTFAEQHGREAGRVLVTQPTRIIHGKSSVSPPTAHRWWPFWRRRQEPASEGAPLALPSRSSASGETDELRSQMLALEAADPPPALMLLADRFGLSSFERSVVLLCAAMELDTRTASLCARAQDNENAPYPTFALAMALFDEPTWDALSSMSPLRYWRLVEIDQRSSLPLTATRIRAEERITNYLKGLNHMDDRLSIMVRPLRLNQPWHIPPSQAADVREITERVRHDSGGSRPPVLQLVGVDRSSKELVSSVACDELGLIPYRMPVDVLPANMGELEDVARLWDRETRLAPVALYLDAMDHESGKGDGSAPSPTNRFLSRTGGMIFIDTRDVWPGLSDSLIVDIERPTADEQRVAWGAALGPEAGESPALLAGQFDLSVAAIAGAADNALSAAPDDAAPLHSRLWDACLSASRPLMEALAQRLDAKATWNDIVLPEQEMRLLWELANQVEQRTKVYDEWGFRRRMNRGLGVSALFSGESGVGKTMAAEVLANHLRLNLYRIDLSAVVSKYIGETEKNLRQLFDAAEDGGAILFFDEADALFGKRSEVKDSHDRYANIEINYLLQRMETYRGLAILSTNMKEALDQAFLRRLRYIVRFPFPAEAQRRTIWERAFPAETPIDDLDFDWLARINFTGGSIHSVSLNAAFLAAQARSNVSMQLVLDAARTELRKLDRPIKDSELRWVPPDDDAIIVVPDAVVG